MGLFNKNERDYGKIQIEYDSTSSKQQMAVVEGDEETLASMIGALIHNLLIDGFDREMLEYAISQGLKDSKKESKKTKNKKVIVKEIKVTEEKGKELEELLKKLVEED